MRRRIAIAAALVALLGIATLRLDGSRDRGADSGCTDAGRPCPPASPRPARPSPVPLDARAFVDTIGINTHLFYVDTSYGNYAMVKRRLLELGIRHVRDGLDPGRTQQFFDRVKDLAAAGIKSTLIACRVEPGGVPWTTFVDDAKRRLRSSLDALEGVNEPDLVAANADWPRLARACQREIYSQAKGSAFGPPLTVPVIGPSVQADDRQLGDISDSADGAAMHSYPGGRHPGSRDGHPFTAQMADVRRNQFAGVRAPVYATETGYHDALNAGGDHPPVSQRAAAIYLPRLFLEYARAGVRRTFVYELVDERLDPTLVDVELNYGLFESDWSHKPSAISLKNTIALLDSPHKGPRRPLRYRLANIADPDGAGPRGAVKDVLLQKADGSYWLALWQDSKVWDESARTDIANPRVPVQVTLDGAMSLASHRPMQSAMAFGRRTARSFTVGVGDDLLLIRMTAASR